MSKVIINSEGKFLSFHEVYSHGPDPCYVSSWVSDVNRASLVTDSRFLSKLKWKDKSPLNEAVAEIDAEEERIVKLVKP